MTIRKTKPRELTIFAKDRTGRLKETPLGNNWVSWRLDIRGKQVDTKLIGRALYKIALGTIALDHGSIKALESRYDAAREFILGHQEFQNNLLIQMKMIPNPQVRITYDFREHGTPCEINILGLSTLFNLEMETQIVVTQELEALNFQEFTLHD